MNNQSLKEKIRKTIHLVVLARYGYLEDALEAENKTTDQLLSLFSQREEELLKEFERIIGEDEKDNSIGGHFMVRNGLRERQRQALQKLKEREGK